IAQSKHEFVLIGSESIVQGALPANARFANPYPRRPLHVRALRRARRIEASARAGLRRFGAKLSAPAEESGTLGFLRSEGIQFGINLGPTVLSMEIPYLVFVWDLEHRCQPYFPELAHKGEWEVRESWYRVLLPRAAAVVTGTQIGKAQIERFYG